MAVIVYEWLHSDPADHLALSPDAFPLPERTTFYGYGVSYAAVGIVNRGRTGLVCGGGRPSYSSINNIFNKCYAYLPFLPNRRWIQTRSKMPTPRIFLGSSVHPDFGLVMTGGWTGKAALASVLATQTGDAFDHSLPNLPEVKSGHCQVTVDRSTIMVFGGFNDSSPTSSAFKLDLTQKKWTPLPDVPLARHRVGCGLIRESGLAAKVIVFGGLTKSGSVDNVDILDLVDLRWSKGKVFKIKFEIPRKYVLDLF